jgi:hypothetical protein
MKICIAIIIFALWGCFVPEKVIEVRVAIVKIVKMEPVHRFEKDDGCKITWQDEITKLEYTSITKPGDYCDFYVVGARYQLLMQR